MGELYRCDKCGAIENINISDYLSGIPHAPDAECDGVMRPLRWTKGGDGSRWEGCTDAHYDCKIAQLEDEIVRLEAEIVRLNVELGR